MVQRTPNFLAQGERENWEGLRGWRDKFEKRRDANFLRQKWSCDLAKGFISKKKLSISAKKDTDTKEIQVPEPCL